MTRLKSLWNHELTDEDKAEVISWFERVEGEQALTQPQIRKRIKERFGIELKHNSQLSLFRDWAFAQLQRDLEAEQMRLDEARLIAEEGEHLTLDQIRERVLLKSYARALATGNFKQGLATVNVEVKARNQALEEKKFKEALRSKIDAGLDALFEEIKHNEQARELFEKFKRVVKNATK